MEEKLKDELVELSSGRVAWDEPLDRYTSFGIGGPADALVRVRERDELARLLTFFSGHGLPWRVVGAGTNLLVRDEGYRGIALLLAGVFNGWHCYEEQGRVTLEAGGGCRLGRLVAACAERGYRGLEFAAGIPGSVGGAVVMNAGAWGGAIADVLEAVEIVTPDGSGWYRRDQLRFAYRTTLLPTTGPALVAAARFALAKADIEVVQATCREYRRRRQERQPGGANAGSIFRNPEGDSAGRLIEASGLKGLAVGGAQISTQHANFIVNRGGATAADVLSLIDTIQQKVARDSGILLETEVHIL